MIAEATATFNSRAKKLKYPMSNQTRGRQCPKLFFVVSALCADFEPEARRYTKLGQDLAHSFDVLSVSMEVPRLDRRLSGFSLVLA